MYSPTLYIHLGRHRVGGGVFKSSLDGFYLATDGLDWLVRDADGALLECYDTFLCDDKGRVYSDSSGCALMINRPLDYDSSIVFHHLPTERVQTITPYVPSVVVDPVDTVTYGLLSSVLGCLCTDDGDYLYSASLSV